MTVTTFVPSKDLIHVKGVVASPHLSKVVRLAFDTASAGTVISRATAESLGYAIHPGLRTVRIVGATGGHSVPVLSVSRFRALGFEQLDYELEVADLPYPDLDGVLGLSFLRKFNYQVRSKEGRILTELAEARA